MFDIGFSELIMIGLVSLLVIGPERLPKVARIAGFWIGKSRSMLSSIQAEIKQELQEEELRQLLKEQMDLEEFHLALNEATEATEAVKASLTELPEKPLIDAHLPNDPK